MKPSARKSSGLVTAVQGQVRSAIAATPAGQILEGVRRVGAAAPPMVTRIVQTGLRQGTRMGQRGIQAVRSTARRVVQRTTRARR